ncbi:MAG: molybdate ABC transporter substrate-binding protein [Anaerolineae bacterium]|nr:MAG: molybdate ABC transporter substrate-binding protein [Anaerolineae bacterium]
MLRYARNDIGLSAPAELARGLSAGGVRICVRFPHAVSLLRTLPVATLLFAAACSSSSRPEPLTIAAAASLAPILDELGKIYEDETGDAVIFSYGSTGNLAQQIRNGAPFDIFASADAQRVDELIAEGFLDEDTRLGFARGVLVLVGAPELELSLRSIVDLADPAIRDVAIANPRHAPYGMAATQTLLRAGVELTVLPKLVYGESVRQAGFMVQTGNTDAGLIALSIAKSMDLQGLELPRELYDPIQHVAAIHSDSSRPEQAARFLELLSSPAAQAVYERSGLIAGEG